MAASDTQVKQQLEQDNIDSYVALINMNLDKQDSVLMLKGLRDLGCVYGTR